MPGYFVDTQKGDRKTRGSASRLTAPLLAGRITSCPIDTTMETVTAESGAVTVGMEDVTAVENFIAGVCPYLLGASKDDITSALHTPDATFKLKKFASDPKNPVLFINLAAPDDEEVEEGTVSAGTLIPLL